ncbi:tryptophan synthase, alpha chain [Halopseudomonas sabulinigri]|uniref:Tryptophan synthase alpha chain n=1 Tax=Halopseudomonas sabulinigri TaxID=472181 RepID=A0A1H1TYI6_9GAMM|nr:tryptophan synthase subunit alpha [Halopseudomonas sabulinigri]SDS64649.1 tryptophan synthase, alpha chain [Halopseudomonas sabulinigri]
MSNRLQQRFAACAKQNRAALVTYICAGDPGYDASLSLLQQLPGAGADIIELGMPFSDPMADGPTIQAAAVRALDNGQTQRKTLEMVRAFRTTDQTTPLVLMGYYNPIHRYGAEAFLNEAHAAGVDGLLIVDLPAEHDNELGPMARDLGLDMIRMASPTTDAKRLPRVLANASGFLYYVSLNGVTGVGQADNAVVDAALAAIRQQSELPICVGFGVRTPEQAAAFARTATGVVVGSALVEAMFKGGEAAALELTRGLAGAMRR